MIHRVLIVDDEPEILAEISEYLRSTGRHVETASSKQSAIHRLVRNSSIQLVLSDIRMPGGDGRSLLAYLRRDLGSSIPFVLMTGQTGADIEQVELEPTAVLSKPIRLRELGRLFDQLESGSQ